jgi:hypothetical protein
VSRIKCRRDGFGGIGVSLAILTARVTLEEFIREAT